MPPALPVADPMNYNMNVFEITLYIQWYSDTHIILSYKNLMVYWCTKRNRRSTYELRVHFAPRVKIRVGQDTLIVHSSVEIIHPMEGLIKTKQDNSQRSLSASSMII